jgi:hypothetical protein
VRLTCDTAAATSKQAKMSPGREVTVEEFEIIEENRFGKEAFESLAKQIAVLKETIDEVKTSNNEHANIVESVTANHSLEMKIDALKESLEAKLGELNTTCLIQNLAWAIDHSKVHKPFNYIEGGATVSSATSLVHAILFQFRKGSSYALPYGAYIGTTLSPITLAAFRDKIVDVIHELTGVKPRFTHEEDQWLIHYY